MVDITYILNQWNVLNIITTLPIVKRSKSDFAKHVYKAFHSDKKVYRSQFLEEIFDFLLLFTVTAYLECHSLERQEAQFGHTRDIIDQKCYILIDRWRSICADTVLKNYSELWKPWKLANMN